MSLAVQIDPKRVRPYTKGAMRAFFDANIGFVTEDGDFVGVATLADNVLFARNDGGYFSRTFEQVRTRNGEPVKGEDGYPKRDPIFGKFFGPDNKPTKESYKFFDLLTEKVVEVLEAGGGVSVGGTKSKVAMPVGASVQEAEPGSPLAEEDDYPW